MKFIHPFYLIGGLLALLARPVDAQTPIFSNLGPGGAYQSNTAWNTSGTNVSAGGVGQAFQFRTPAGGDLLLNDIEIAGALLSGPNELDLSLFTDAGGLPGTPLETYHVSGALGPFGQNNPLLTALSTTHPALHGDTNYWLAAFAGTPDTNAAWNFNSTGDLSPNRFDFGSFSYLYLRHATFQSGRWRLFSRQFSPNPSLAPVGAFALNAVPEPGVLSLLTASGLAALFSRRRYLHPGRKSSRAARI